jgi:hypothetical protein
MATLSEDSPRAFQLGDTEEYPVVASDIIYEGAAVGENASGYARPLVAGDVFLDFALERVDNSAGAAGDKRIKVRTRGRVQVPVGSLAITDNDRVAVYASDDDTFTKTASSNSLIGYVSRFVTTGVGVVEFDAALVKAALQA